MVQCRLLENLETHGLQENPGARAAIKIFLIHFLHRFRQLLQKTAQLHFIIWRYLNSGHRQNEHKCPPTRIQNGYLPLFALPDPNRHPMLCILCLIISLFFGFVIGFDRGDEANISSLMVQAVYKIHVRSFSDWKIVTVTNVTRCLRTPNYIWILFNIQLILRSMYTPPMLQQTVC